MKLSEANHLRLLYFLVLSCTASWLPIFADNLKERGLSGIEISIILSLTPVMMFAVQPFYGAMADRCGYKRCLLVSCGLASIAFLLFLLNVNFAGLFFATLVMSLFYNGIQPILDSAALAISEKNPAFNYGTLRLAGALGWSVTGIVVGHFIHASDTNVIFISSSIALFATFLVALTLKEINAGNTQAGNAYSGIRAVVSNANVRFLLIGVFLISAAVTTIWNFYSIYMKENGASATLVGYGLSLQGLCEIPFFYFSAAIIRVLNLKNTLILTSLAAALRMCLYGIVDNPQTALAIEVLHGLSWSLFWVVCVEYINQLVPGQWKVTGQSMLYAAYFGIGAIAGNFWTGWLYDLQISMSNIFLLNAGIVLIVVLFMVRFIQKPKAKAVEETSLVA